MYDLEACVGEVREPEALLGLGEVNVLEALDVRVKEFKEVLRGVDSGACELGAWVGEFIDYGLLLCGGEREG